MANCTFESKDCLPFENKNNNQTLLDETMRRLCNYWYDVQSRRDADEEPIASLQTRFYNKEISTRWWAGRYIGIAHLLIPKPRADYKQVKISIRPRFGENFLLALIEDVYNIKTPKQEADIETNYSNEWFSALLRLLRRKMWIDKCAKANRYGLPRKTVKREYKGVTLHGAIDVRHTIVSWQSHKEVCTFTYEKAMDEQIGKILYEANRILTKDAISFQQRKKSKNSKNNKNSVFGFSVPSVVQDTINLLNIQYKGMIFDVRENDYKRIRYKSIYQSWKPLVDFSWDVICGKQSSFKASESISDCVFIDMAEIWEAFLRKKLGEAFRNDGWRVLTVEECKFVIYQNTFYERSIIPDIIMERDGKYIVFDAKYKRMLGINDDVDRTDLFQIHTYVQYVERCMGEVVLAGLLYPITSEQVNEDTYHSISLFGKNKGNRSPFIIDGIVCKENDKDSIITIEAQKENIDNNVDAMIKRIKGKLKEKTVN